MFTCTQDVKHQENDDHLLFCDPDIQAGIEKLMIHQYQAEKYN